MLRLLDVNEFSNSLEEVTTSELFEKTGDYREDGLFSEKIFGPIGSIDRRRLFAYIDLQIQIVHPSVLKILLQLERKIDKFLSTEESFILDSNGRLEENEKGITGITEFVKLFPEIKYRGETSSREKLIQFIEKETKRNTIFINKIPVIPPDLRPAVKDEGGGWMIDKLNDMYIAIMRRVSQVSSSGSGPLKELLSYALQNSVIDHDTYVRTKIQKKSGIIRNQMLGKRVDFSGRAVVTPNPKLNIGEAGVPLRIAVRLFEPFIIHRLLYSGVIDKENLSREIIDFTGFELTVDSIKRVLKGIKEGDKLPESLYKIFYEATEVSMMNRVVVVKRDPVLQTQSYAAYNPILHSGNTLELSTLQVGAHNADFDGDEMSVYHPLTDESQREAREKMMRVTSGTSSDDFAFGFSKEMWAGLYILTKDKKSTKPAIAVNEQDLNSIKEPYTPVKYRGVLTTSGRAIFNSCLPKNYPFQNILVNKKLINNIIKDIFKKYGTEILKETSNKIKEVAFKWVTIIAPSINIDQFELPKRIYEIKDRIKKMTEADAEEAQILLDEAKDIVAKSLEDTGFGDLVISGSTKGWGQPMQILVAKGIIADSKGNILKPVAGSFAEGLTNIEFFHASQGARKGIIDRVINTAETGYASRKFAYFLNTVEIDRQLKDCKTTRTIDIKVDKDLIDRLKGRNILKGGKLISFDDAKIKEGELIHLRTPIYCKSKKLCHTCYGRLLERHKTPYAGILAAQIIGERGTQMIMKCSDGLVHYNENLVAFKDLWNSIDSPINIIDGKETKSFKSFINGKDNKVRTYRIQRHKPTEKLLFISTKNGHTLICQKNHPLLIKEKSIHNKWLNEKCRLIGDELYTEIQSTRKFFTTNDNNVTTIEANELKQYDSIWIDNTIAFNNTNEIVPDLNGYICGIYLAEGSKLGKGRQTKGLGITQQDGPIKDRILECCYDYKKYKSYRDGVTIWDNDENMSNVVYGNYAWEKRLRPDFINFSKDWLKDFLSGLIDGDGTVFNNPSTCCRIATSSYYLVQQLKAICLKLGYKMNTTIVTGNKEYRKGALQRRVNFSCDIRFREYDKLKSVKLENNNDIIPCKLRIESDIKGFDIITIIKEVWKWEYYVYDVQTESSEYMLGFMQNHNTFHTGGAVTLVKRDMLADIINNDPTSGLEL